MKNPGHRKEVVKKQKDGVTINNPTPKPRRVRKVMTTRAGGVSRAPYESFNLGDHVGDDPAAVAENREHFARVLGLPMDRVLYMEQVHSPTVTVVNGSMTSPIEATDAMVTTERDLALVVLTADCVPLLLSDDVSGIVAAVHAGRLGARNGIVKATVETMIRCGAKPAHMHALMGAAASGERYEVPADMVRDVEQHLPGSSSTTQWGTPSLDLRRGLVRQLMSMGVTAIDADPRCTISEDATFFSYRREGTTGRQAAAVWMPSAAWT